MAQNVFRNEAFETGTRDQSQGANNPAPKTVAPESKSQVRLLHPPARAVPETINEVLFKLGIEPTLTVREASVILRWSYWKTRRYFRGVEGVCVCYQPKRYKRPYRIFTIPLSVFAREWQKMTGQQPLPAEIIHQRVFTLVQ
jgi:hypothetical protein